MHTHPARLAAVLLGLLPATLAQAQVLRPLHVDPSVTNCSIALDPALSREAFQRFSRQAGLLISGQRSPPGSLGPLGFEVGLELGATMLNQWDDAWHDTFVHPHAEHVLGGTPLTIPRLYARLGVAERWDAGAFFTTDPTANFSFLGTDVKYTALAESGTRPDVAVRLSHTVMLGVSDMVLNTGGVDVSAGKRFGLVSLYVGAGGLASFGTETTSKLDYGTQAGFSPRAFVGVALDLPHFRAVLEADLAEVQTYALRLSVR